MIQETAPNFFQRWGDIASVFGVIVSFVGFAVTIWGVIRSKNAAQKAEEEVLKVKGSILKLNTVMGFSEAITIMDEIKRLHRAAVWDVLPDRYSLLRRILIEIKSSNSALPDDYKEALQEAIRNFSAMENEIEWVLETREEPPNTAKLNEVVSIQLDKLSEVLAAVRQEVGDNNARP
jgi:hypothetical protein